MELAKAMARAVLADELDSFNRREITHTCRAFRSATEWQRMAALRALEDHGWIEGESLMPEHGGRWLVNRRFCGWSILSRCRRFGDWRFIA